MAVYNVTPISFDHVCSANNLDGSPLCRIERKGLSHNEIEIVPYPLGDVIVVTCPDGHRESFKNDLESQEEISPTRDENSRELVRNVRALYRYYKTGNNEK